MLSFCRLRVLRECLQKQLFISAIPLLRMSSAAATNAEKYDLVSPENDPVIDTRLLKIAVIGTPNVGKSTLINQIVERRVFAMSKKVHTTRCRSRAIHIEGNTQLIFLDTPGVVTASESQKYNLGQNFLSGGEDAIEEADVIGVVHDVSNAYTRNKLDPKVLRLLHLHQDKESFLVLNKIDTIRTKRTLLNLSATLTGNKLRNYKEPVTSIILTETSILDVIKNKSHWEKFSDVFMVSALLGQGTKDIKTYLLNAAHPGKWVFEEHEFTDKKPLDIIEEAVKSKLLDHLPNEVPYSIDVELEYLDMNPEDHITAVVLVSCNTTRIEKLVMGSGGQRIRKIAKEAEQVLVDTFLTSFHLRLVLSCKKAKLHGAQHKYC